MRKGMLEYCVLLLLSHRRLYPSNILEELKEAKMIVVEGTLYTLLNRLLKEGKLTYMWQESPKGPPRKYFLMTNEGRDALKIMTEEWAEINRSINYFKTKEEQQSGE